MWNIIWYKNDKTVTTQLLIKVYRKKYETALLRYTSWHFSQEGSYEMRTAIAAYISE